MDSAAKVAVIGQTVARQLFGNDDALRRGHPHPKHPVPCGRCTARSTASQIAYVGSGTTRRTSPSAPTARARSSTDPGDQRAFEAARAGRFAGRPTAQTGTGLAFAGYRSCTRARWSRAQSWLVSPTGSSAATPWNRPNSRLSTSYWSPDNRHPAALLQRAQNLGCIYLDASAAEPRVA